MQTIKKNNPPKKKLWRVFLIWICVIYMWMKRNSDFNFNKEIKLESWQSAQVFFEDLNLSQKFLVKRYARKHDIDFGKVQQWNYIFSGSYSPSKFVEVILAWPQVVYEKIKVLEWWSIYDIDNYLSIKSLIKTGEYITFVKDSKIIEKYKLRFDFLKWLSISSLEWFLYPDTYKVDKDKNIIDQLVFLQLDNFNKRVWTDAKDMIWSASLNRLNTIKLASIVEKEERNSTNRPIVAGILMKRLNLGTLIWADISLCYNFALPYKECTPSFIGQHVADSNNPYNTRSVKWLPPTPIGNPTNQSILAVLKPTSTEYFFYLHDNDWIIHYGKTLEEHNANVRNYLR